jgi:succinate dehydrogenase hydrophobic anchor subunit
MFDLEPKKPLYRSIAALAGLVLLGFGLATIRSHGDMVYKNWFGELMFSPFAIIFGLLILWGALFKPEILGKSTRTKR